ncbi:putative receptor-like serine/threonine-protein kinase [Citrus sinensis]|uniref:Receptor-like serine/threonine-protein kinase n=1 Tax=Citrus sinensis TaxID=2711 RepID=A0ACB8IGM1_CITSI|nr:putative receptor-like serine/threonine-protein kinase [Citrus sinensis]
MSVSGSSNSGNTFPQKMNSKTQFLNLKLYVLVAIILTCVALVSLSICLCFCFTKNSRKRKMRVKHSSGLIPLVSKEIVEIKDLGRNENCEKQVGKIGKEGEIVNVVNVEVGKKKKKSEEEEQEESDDVSGKSSDVAVDMGWGRWYSLGELEIATRGFAEENVIGEGGYGIVYRGVLQDGSVVAVKNLLNNKMLVYEYVDNGNLEQWLHGDVGSVSPLTWDIRMKIAIGTAKGLAYLHEGLEPKVVHRDVKSSNILLDRKWNPKVSDFGLAKLLGSEASYVTTRVMGTFGYVSPEYASTGMLNEGSDVYSFGVLLMEIITGRSPIDYSRPAGEMNMVDWFKGMVASRRGEELVDPLIEVQPSPRALKRALLVCLRCIDMDAHKRPKMGQIVHMLEADDFPFRSVLFGLRTKQGSGFKIQFRPALCGTTDMPSNVLLVPVS